MKTIDSVNWSLLLETDKQTTKMFANWSVGGLTTSEVVTRLAHSEFAGEFRRLIRNNGTTYARRLARKALRYRGTNV
jgi:hypothetical protein